jgi:hypothetical protein
MGPPSPLSPPTQKKGSWFSKSFQDLLYVLALWWGQTYLLPLGFLDIWLSMILIERSFNQSLFALGLSIVLVEGSSWVPRGFGLCVYGVLALSFDMVKQHISWRRHRSWVLAMGAASLWMIFFEGLVMVLAEEGALYATGSYGWFVMGRLVLAMGVGYVVSLQVGLPKKGVPGG